jgi:hypothetical protein
VSLENFVQNLPEQVTTSHLKRLGRQREINSPVVFNQVIRDIQHNNLRGKSFSEYLNLTFIENLIPNPRNMLLKSDYDFSSILFRNPQCELLFVEDLRKQQPNFLGVE